MKELAFDKNILKCKPMKVRVKYAGPCMDVVLICEKGWEHKVYNRSLN